MRQFVKAIEWFQLSKKIQKQATKAMIKANGIERLGRSYLQEMKSRVSYYNLAIEALEKQIPKKPIKKNLTRYCPECGLGNISTQFCPYCGQLIHWD